MLSRTDIERTHGASIRILERTGAIVRSASARSLLRSAGAEITEEKMHVLFPENLVSDALKSASKEFVLGARNPKHDLKIPSDGFPYLSTDGFPVQIWDHALQKKRPSTRSDLEKWATLADALDAVDLMWPSTTPTDLPPLTQLVGGLRTSYEHTTKHVQYQAVDGNQAKAEIQMACAVAGSDEENRRRPHFSSVQCIIAPLQYDEGSTDAVIEFARAGIPVVAMTMVSPGITGPTTLAGSLALANAEVLGSLVISQLAKSGSPMFYCFVCAPLDMKSGNFVMGAPEYGLMSVAGAEMAHHYRLPSMMGGLGNTGKSPGFQLGFEKGVTTTAAALAGCDLMTGLGGLNDSMFVSMEQMLIDSDVWEHVRRSWEGIDVDENEIAMDVIEKAGPKGQYLSHPHTLANFRRLYMPRYADRSSYDSWVAGGKKEMYDIAHVEVEKILAEHEPTPLSEDISKRLRDIETAFSKHTS
jgi:trimethylamine--corrinoid protein Co-methyltransferase